MYTDSWVFQIIRYTSFLLPQPPIRHPLILPILYFPYYNHEYSYNALSSLIHPLILPILYFPYYNHEDSYNTLSSLIHPLILPILYFPYYNHEDSYNALSSLIHPLILPILCSHTIIMNTHTILCQV